MVLKRKFIVFCKSEEKSCFVEFFLCRHVGNSRKPDSLRKIPTFVASSSKQIEQTEFELLVVTLVEIETLILMPSIKSSISSKTKKSPFLLNSKLT